MIQNKDIGSLTTTKRAFANTALTAGGTGDNTAVTGVIIDRAAMGWPKSCNLAVSFTATLAATKDLALTWTLQEGDDSGLSDAATLTSATAEVIASSAGGGTVTGCYEVPVSLEGAGRYVRLNVTPNLSASGTDTAAIAGVIVFGGAERLPQ